MVRIFSRKEKKAQKQYSSFLYARFDVIMLYFNKLQDFLFLFT